jgi:alpha-glucosidase
MSWWKHGVLYQIYPRSFADSDADGIGNIRGVIDHLDHLQWLGVDGIWLSPITCSPNADWGYDVSDYCGVQPEYGTLDDVDELIASAGERGLRVLLDLVPNHTSDRHPWFVDSRSSRTSKHRDWYVWADPKPDGSPPNNWVSHFGGPAWTIDETTGQYDLHNFAPEQPDLNWWNDEVRDAFDGILRFWFDRGIAGFRIDVCHIVVKDAELRDNPPATDDDAPFQRLMGQRFVYNYNRPEVHDVIRRWRSVADGYDPQRVLLGESVVMELDALMQFYGKGDELHLPMNMPFIHSKFDGDRLRAIVEQTESVLPDGAWPVWVGSNHDVSHLATRWARGDEAKARMAVMMLLTLRGTTLLYQGDEIGMPDTALEQSDIVDPVGVKFWPARVGRDPERTPMPWTGEEGAGFTQPGTKPWLPFGDVAACNVAAQRGDAGSILHMTRDLIALRRAKADLQSGDYASMPSPDGVWVWRRGDGVVVALNFSDAPARLDDVHGTIAIATDRSRDGELVKGALELAASQGVVVTV